MEDLTTLSSSELENKLWHLGLNSHNLSKKEIDSYISFIKKSQKKLKSATILNAISYILHTYFSCMNEKERYDCIRLLLSIEIKNLTNYGDIFDMLGILFKLAPEKIKKQILDYILDNSRKCLENPSALISVCNAFSYIFDELAVSDKNQVVNKLTEIISKNTHSHLQDTLLFTLALFKEENLK